MDTVAFLDFVITSKQGGWLPICSSDPDGENWRQQWRAWPDDRESTEDLIRGLHDDNKNVYYSAHLFNEKNTHKQYAMETRTIFCDLDRANIADILLRPSLMVKSSNDRHQGYWRLNDWLSIEKFEQLSHRITYGIKWADHSGWYIGHMMRVPNTLNYKYDPAQRVRVTTHNGDTYNPLDFGIFPIDDGTRNVGTFTISEEWVQNALKVPAGYGTIVDLWDATKDKLAKGTDVYMYTLAPDRSAALWRLELELFRAGLPPEHVFALAYSSVNNKFLDLRYNSELELAKDILRAQVEIASGPRGIRDRVNEQRRQNSPISVRRQTIAAMVRNQMETHGKFVHARGGTLWYVLHDEGKPIPLSRVSTQLNVILDTMFGLNATEAEHNYVVADLINHTAALPADGEIGSLSYYVAETNTLLLHTGKKDVIRITPDNIDMVTNGYRNVVFAWNDEASFDPALDAQLSEHWSNLLFEDALANVAIDSLTQTQALALMRSWLVTILLRNMIVSRPILAVLGQPGSGKSTLFRRIYALLYGPHKAVSGITSAEDFDFQLASDPLLILDNLDTWERWLPDRIARAAAISEIKKRKLYTDTDTVTMRSQAMLGISAHNPKFGREDVADRLIIIMLERLRGFKSESGIMQHIGNMRNELWGAICQDVQRVLREPKPTKIPQFRVEDFAELGQRIANALGYADDFYSAITTLVVQQKGMVLDEDSMIVDIIDKYTRNPNAKPDEYKTPARLWAQWELLSSHGTFGRQYGNSIKLGKKLWAMQDALRARFDVQYKMEDKTRVWRITKKDDNG